MKLTRLQADACQALQEELTASSGSLASGDDVTSQLDDVDWQSYLENCTDLSEDSDDEMFEGEDVNLQEEEHMSFNNGLQEVSWDFIAETPVQARILDLLIALYTHLPIGSDDKFFSPILRFLVLLSRKKTGQWALPRRITQFFAVLLFCGREVMMALMHREVLADRKIRYSQ